MQRYKISIQDMREAVFRLSDMEELCFRRVVDLHCHIGGAVPDNMEWISARVGIRVDIVQRVVQCCFFPEKDGWVLPWMMEQIAAHKSRQAVNRENGRNRWNGKEQIASESLANRYLSLPLAHAPASKDLSYISSSEELIHDPQSTCISHEEEDKKKNVRTHAPKRTCALAEKPDEVNQQTWDDFMAQRKTMRAPLTKTALNGIIREASKAGWNMEDALSECVVRGWRGFKSEWVSKNKHEFKNVDYGVSGGL